MIDIIRDEFINLEALHFNITNCYQDDNYYYFY